MKSAFIFPGQGSQSVGMLSGAAGNWPIVAQTFAEASDLLGYDLWKLCQKGPAEDLNQTAYTQPALLTASVALWRQWFVAGGRAPDFLAGHSLGEYSALVAAESLNFFDAVKLVRLRGELMQNAVPKGQGRMAAILGLDDADVVAACAEASGDGVVAAANFNAPGQVVIAGDSAAVDRAIELCKERGARKTIPLPVSVPSHCALMKTAAEELTEALNEVSFNNAVIPVVQNVTATTEQSRDVIKANLVHQLYSPVLWVDCVKALVANNVQVAVECGSGNVLTGLIKRIDRGLPVHTIETQDTLAAAVAAVGQS